MRRTSTLSSGVITFHPLVSAPQRPVAKTEAVPVIGSLAAAVAGWPPLATTAAAAVGFFAIVLALKKVFDTPARSYDNNVGDEYDRQAC